MRTSFARSSSLDTFAHLCALAEGQWGQVALSQLSLAPKVLKQWEEARIIEPVADGVIRVCAGGRHPHPTIYAAWLRSDNAPAWERSTKTLVVSHRSAVQLYGAGSLPGEQLELTGTAAQPVGSGVVVHSALLTADDFMVVEGLPVTTPARTLVDLVLDEGLDVSELGRVARALVGQGWATEEQLGTELSDAFAGRGVPRDGVQWLSAAFDAAKAG